MKLPSIPLNSSTASFSGRVGLSCSRICDFPVVIRRRKKSICDGVRFPLITVMADQRSSEAMDGESIGGFTSSAMEVTTLDSFKDPESPVWDKIGAVVRLSFGIG